MRFCLEVLAGILLTTEPFSPIAILESHYYFSHLITNPSSDIQSEEHMLTTSYKCSEQGCQEYVKYEMELVLGFQVPGQTSLDKTKVVYLTCPNNHTRRYIVPA